VTRSRKRRMKVVASPRRPGRHGHSAPPRSARRARAHRRRRERRPLAALSRTAHRQQPPILPQFPPVSEVGICAPFTLVKSKAESILRVSRFKTGFLAGRRDSFFMGLSPYVTVVGRFPLHAETPVYSVCESRQPLQAIPSVGRAVGPAAAFHATAPRLLWPSQQPHYSSSGWRRRRLRRPPWGSDLSSQASRLNSSEALCNHRRRCRSRISISSVPSSAVLQGQQIKVRRPIAPRRAWRALRQPLGAIGSIQRIGFPAREPALRYAINLLA
jgi:hypothetical protein